jgi:hypothetical protein
MNSATTSRLTPDSTSIPAPPTPSKLAVVARQHPLVALRLAGPGSHTLVDGTTRSAAPGDWLITRGKTVIDVCRDPDLRDRYQIIESGSVSISAATCVLLENTLGIGATQSTERLLAAVERLATIKIGEIRIDFTPGQLEEIALRAKKRNQTVQQAMQAVIDRIREELFWRS